MIKADIYLPVGMWVNRWRSWIDRGQQREREAGQVSEFSFISIHFLLDWSVCAQHFLFAHWWADETPKLKRCVVLIRRACVSPWSTSTQCAASGHSVWWWQQNYHPLWSSTDRTASTGWPRWYGTTAHSTNRDGQIVTEVTVSLCLLLSHWAWSSCQTCLKFTIHTVHIKDVLQYSL